MTLPDRKIGGRPAFKTGEAKANFAELLRRAEAGERILILHGNDPVAQLGPVDRPPPRRPGRLRHWRVPDDLFAPLPEEEQRILEGEGTDAAGIWVGLPTDAKPADGEGAN